MQSRLNVELPTRELYRPVWFVNLRITSSHALISQLKLANVNQNTTIFWEEEWRSNLNSF